MAPHSGIDTSDIKAEVRENLLDLLAGIRGKKNLVIEKSLLGPLGIFVKFSTLQDHGVDKVFSLENDNVDSTQKNVVFLARAEKASKPIAITEQIQRVQKESNTEHEFSIIWVPRRTLISDKILEEAGVLGDVGIMVLSLQFVPLEPDVLSLCLDDSFKDLYLRKDPTSIFVTAEALMRLQQNHGLFPRIVGKGDYAHRLMELLLRMRTEVAANDSVTSRFGLMPSVSVESLIIMDREVDFATPLLTQLTYEGLIDEMFGIRDNQAEIDAAIVGATPSPQHSGKGPAMPTQQGLKRKIQLDSSDKLYEQLRDSNGAIVDGLLNKVARRLQSEMENRHNKSVSELREFVSKLPGYQSEQQSLKIHISLTEEIMKTTQTDIFRGALEVQQNLYDGTDPSYQHETIEELIARDVSLISVLRLICLESCISGGLRTKELDNFKRLILHAYGYQHILTFDALERIGLISTRASANVLTNPLGTGSSAPEGSKTNYNYLRRMLKLVVDEVNEQNPNDIAYVYSGYAPLSVRLIQAILQKQRLLAITRGTAYDPNTLSGAAHGWQGFEDVLRNVKGETFNKVQKGEEQAVKARHMLSGTGSKPKTVIIMFLGGVTFAEIAALRFIAKVEEGRRKFIICTTDVLSGNRMMEAAIEKGDFGKV